MTPRSFWTILIKILGIYIILESLITIPQLIGLMLGIIAQPSQFEGLSMFLSEAIYFILVFVLYGTLLYYCLFKTDWIIDKLKLDQGFSDERFEFTMHRSTVLKIAIMVIGGILLIDSFPILCKDAWDSFHKTDIYGGFAKNPNSTYLLIYLLKTFIGYFMLTCSRMIVNYIELKRKTPITEEAKD